MLGFVSAKDNLQVTFEAAHLGHLRSEAKLVLLLNLVDFGQFIHLEDLVRLARGKRHRNRVDRHMCFLSFPFQLNRVIHGGIIVVLRRVVNIIILGECC